MKKTFLLTSFVALAAAQSAFAVNYDIENTSLTFWGAGQSFHEADIWKLGSVPTLLVGDTVSISSKTTDSTINLSEFDVSVAVVKLGRYGNGASIATLNVTANLTTSGVFEMADSNIHRIKNSAETSVTVNVVFNYKNNERTQLQSPLQRAS
jgi:hypothetical protein